MRDVSLLKDGVVTTLIQNVTAFLQNLEGLEADKLVVSWQLHVNSLCRWVMGLLGYSYSSSVLGTLSMLL